jgi:hypothetical protein
VTDTPVLNEYQRAFRRSDGITRFKLCHATGGNDLPVCTSRQNFSTQLPVESPAEYLNHATLAQRCFSKQLRRCHLNSCAAEKP